MKINKIKINSFRGIVDFEAVLESNSMVITGSNGTGKSGVIDAIDFLLTGDLQRLRGDGTKTLSLEAHGKHVDKELQDVSIEAEIQDGPQKYYVCRKLKDKKIKLIEGDSILFDDFVLKMEAGQLLLSRRELLKFIACTGQKRSDEIQALLDTSGIEKIRKALMSVVTAQKKKVGGLDETIKSSLQTANQYLGIISGGSKERRIEINDLRQKLKKEPIAEWGSNTDIICDIPAITNDTLRPQKRLIFEKQINAALSQNNIIPNDFDGISVKVKMAQILVEINQIVNFFRLISGGELISKGIDLLENNICPLCDVDWNDRDLLKHLNEKNKLSERAVELKAQYDILAIKYISSLRQLISHFEALRPTIQAAKAISLDNKINTSIELMRDRIAKVSDIQSALAIQTVLLPEKLLIDLGSYDALIDELASLKNSLPDETDEEKALKTLHQVAALFKNISENSAKLKIATDQLNVSVAINECFTKCREDFFSSLFNDIEQDFIKYYRFLNEDEDKFAARITANEKIIDLQVTFYDRGLHPPHALHSEGHQDSMGICLFLALMKKLKGSQFSLALLDDVMMSIDIAHRRRLCELLKNEFLDTQFIITTHDPIWARQLKEFGIIHSKNLFHFRNWSLAAGPIFEAKELWEILRDKVKAGYIHDAAAGLRRNLEQEFQEICTNLRAKVTFKSSHSWELGELKSAAISTYKALLAKAKDAANSWGNREVLEKLKRISDNLTVCINKSRIEEWQINPSVHYNEWGNFSKEEIIATIDALENLILAFNASDNTKFSLSFQLSSPDPVAITSVSGTDNFTLIQKNK